MSALSRGRLLFGTAGVPQSTLNLGTSTLFGIQQIHKLGLDCLEIEFVRGLKMGSDTAGQIKKASQKYGVSLSVHAPYYINLNSPEEGKRIASQERIMQSARLAEMCGAKNVVFHPGYYGKGSAEEAYECVRKEIKEVISILRQDRNRVVLRPETMGKKSQFGSLEEILFLCQEIDGILPCVDFSHIHTRSGKANTYLEFHRILKKIEKKLGKEALKNMHIHVSGAIYSDKGEIKHINLQESDFRYDEWVQVLKDLDVEGSVICESPEQDKDALLLKNLFSVTS